jgi:hypothetical protein
MEEKFSTSQIDFLNLINSQESFSYRISPALINNWIPAADDPL